MFNKPLITLDYFIGGPSRPSKQPSIYELIGGSPGTPIIAICQQSLATLLRGSPQLRGRHAHIVRAHQHQRHPQIIYQGPDKQRLSKAKRFHA